MTIYGWKELNRDKNNNLVFRNRTMCTLVPSETIPKHYHLKFEWRDEPTPEFFNIFNARENARIICLGKLNNNIKKPAQEVTDAFK